MFEVLVQAPQLLPLVMQELRVFLEGDGVLALCPEWQRLQPANGTLLDGVARLPKQLLGKSQPQQNAAMLAHIHHLRSTLHARMRRCYTCSRSTVLNRAQSQWQCMSCWRCQNEPLYANAAVFITCCWHACRAGEGGASP